MKDKNSYDVYNFCFYCDMPLSQCHEHDHFPIPVRFGGIETVPTCINCHDLKDRMLLEDWNSIHLWEAFKNMSPVGRILLAKAYVLIFEAQTVLKSKK